MYIIAVKLSKLCKFYFCYFGCVNLYLLIAITVSHFFNSLKNLPLENTSSDNKYEFTGPK